MAGPGRMAYHAAAMSSTPDGQLWGAVAARDGRFDGDFVYAVTTTGIYCRPSCPARRPSQEHVRFFGQPGEAERAGFRPCRRCRPDQPLSPQAEMVERARAWIDAHADEPSTLADLGAAVGASPSHLRRSFKRLLGVTPRQHRAARRLERLKARLRQGEQVTMAIYEAGYGSLSRVYEGASARLGMTPQAYRRGGDGQEVRYTLVDCPLGRLLVAATERGICATGLSRSDAALEAFLRDELPAAALVRDDGGLRPLVEPLLEHLAGRRPRLDLPLDVQATDFQRAVWETLRMIPYGETRTYGQVARSLGRPTAVRAVARACATNPAAIVIPCHRVVGADGGLRGYRWGVERKQRLLERERG